MEYLLMVAEQCFEKKRIHSHDQCSHCCEVTNGLAKLHCHPQHTTPPAGIKRVMTKTCVCSDNNTLRYSDVLTTYPLHTHTHTGTHAHTHIQETHIYTCSHTHTCNTHNSPHTSPSHLPHLSGFAIKYTDHSGTNLLHPNTQLPQAMTEVDPCVL